MGRDQSRSRSVSEPDTEEVKRTPVPKALTICLWARVPGSTTRLAMRSASMIGMSWEARSAETVDFPVAIPPVRPTTADWKKIREHHGWSRDEYQASKYC